MRRIVPTVLPVWLLISSLCYGQSLSDTARQVRQEKQKNGTAAKKVITTDDLSPSADPKPVQDSKPDSPKKIDDSRPLPYKNIPGFTPAMWTNSTKAQKQWVVHLQEAAEKLKTMRQVDMKKLATDPEERKFSEERTIAQQLASQIPEQQKKLEEIQDEARKAGMPASVYDPQ